MKITNDAITLNNQIYPTKNISSARMVERKSHTFQKGWPYFQRVVTFMAIGIFLAVFGFNAEIEPLLGLAAMIAGVIVFFRGFVRPRTEGKEYGIELLSNSGGMTLFWSRDQEFMIQVRDLIFAALTSSGNAFNYTVNIDNKKIEDHSVNVLDRSVHHVYDYSVHFAQHQGISVDQLNFLNGQFNEALKELGNFVRDHRNEELQKELQSLVTILRAQNPDKGKLKTAWGRLKDICDVWETGDTVKSILSTIAMGVNTILGVVT